MEKFDLVVIGSGPGGYPAAIRAAQLGASVAIVEREKLGGTCLNWGCIPTKSLIAAADHYAAIEHAEAFGISTKGASYDYAAMVDRKNGIVSQLRNGVGSLLKGNKVTVFEGTAAFTARDKLTIKKGKKTQKIGAKNVIIATGSTATMPSFIPKHEAILESRAFLDLKKMPKSLLVLGGGVIGCEFACMAAMLGVKVTIVEMLDDILPILDKDIRRELRRQMEKDLGITILTGKPLENIKATAKGVTGTCGGEKVSAAQLLVSVGRSPVTDGLCLDKAGLDLDERGFIEVDRNMRTRVASIFAIGDVTAGTTQLAHAATAQGVTAAENACGRKQTPAETLVPACIFTVPEVGSVGLSEADAAEQGIAVTVGKYMFGGLGRALAVGAPGGFVKLIADAATDQLLGAHAVGLHATELIAEAAVAIRAELTAEELGATIHCHPTLGEAWMEAAHAVHGACIHQPPKRR